MVGPYEHLSGPLSGLRVLEMAEGVAGPMTGRLLADAGADVIKVERGSGDYTRRWSPQWHGTGAAYIWLNRSKRSIRVESFAAPECHALASLSDVLIADHGEVDVGAIQDINASLVVGVVSGWGVEGPWSERRASELATQLASEATSSLGRVGDEPVRIGTDHASMSAAFYLMQGVIAALISLEPGRGQRVDVSLFGSLLHLRSTLWVALSNPDDWSGFHLDSYLRRPMYGYTCSDGRLHISLGRVDDMEALVKDLRMDFVLEDERWPLFRSDVAGVMGRHADSLHELWDRGLSRWTIAEAVGIIELHGGWAFPFLDFEALLADPHARDVGLLQPLAAPSLTEMPQLRTMWRFSDTPVGSIRPAPQLDEHGDDIRAALG
ncbi:MAG TPA: CaiB/BaiF CoA-transferase family protein [Acidimicrobiales bacterium]|nr:CaiB/BaiF CoA-transferase family protein [Acidimicrobiales bacterium]